MARYRCPRMDCTVSLKLSAPPVCPVHGHRLQPYSKPGVIWVDAMNTDCLAEKENAERLAAEQKKFSLTVFKMSNFVPCTARGLFDIVFSPSARTLEITVRVYCDFVMGGAVKDAPKAIAEGFEKLTPWTEKEKGAWMAEAVISVGKAWDNKGALCLDKGGWPQLVLRPVFTLKFVSSKQDANVSAEVKKIPPVDPTFFNCGGTFVGLDQIITSNPQAVSKASLTSESGKPVDLQAQNLGLQLESVIHYNVMAHEFGHMIGLPDEYENPTFSEKGTPAQNAKVIHKNGTLKLAERARVAYAPFGEYTESIMSRGTVVHRHHFVTVWEALVAMTKGYVAPDEWEIQ